MALHRDDLAKIRKNFEPAAADDSYSLSAACYTDPAYLQIDREAIFYRTWQFVCHGERLKEPGRYVTFEIQGRPLFAVRDKKGDLRAFYNVCKHRAHELLVQGEGQTSTSSCAPITRGSMALTGNWCEMRRIPRNAEGFQRAKTSVLTGVQDRGILRLRLREPRSRGGADAPTRPRDLANRRCEALGSRISRI